MILDCCWGADGTEVIPAAWIDETRSGGDPAMFEEFMADVHPGGSYRNQFWITGDDHGSFYAAGAHGQYLWLDPVVDVVVAKLAAAPVAEDPDVWAGEVAFMERSAGH